MSVSYIPDRVKFCLWGKTAGRCQYHGCNKTLYMDSLTKSEFNTAYIAHIIADKPGGPRGHPVLSGQLKSDISNLMLMCDEHHRKIDKEDVQGHTVDRLRLMKKDHESRIELTAGISQECQSHIVLFGSRIGEHDSPLNFKAASSALLPEKYPASQHPIELGLNSTFQDNEDEYWELQQIHLTRIFQLKVKTLIESGHVADLSVFGLAPIPLLTYLGRLLSDIPTASVFQLQREPQGWKWQTGTGEINYTTTKIREREGKQVALILSLSASITEDRITDALGDDCSIWEMSIESPHNDFMNDRAHLKAFREAARRSFNEIKLAHGSNAQLNVFPAIPVSAAIELGRVWMPKADMPFWIYDQNNQKAGFSRALYISQES